MDVALLEEVSTRPEPWDFRSSRQAQCRLVFLIPADSVTSQLFLWYNISL